MRKKIPLVVSQGILQVGIVAQRHSRVSQYQPQKYDMCQNAKTTDPFFCLVFASVVLSSEF
ncbi:hypothetical protein [Nostoc sp. CMAA1605]|uniref:hypothetical protein n=1 Tax=Nostoc sp. CMAA1605 TaxID=2055159 RepID=UPI001F1BE07A|nr:hypothetical protein [Nostoc sp. CMAA1605]